MKFTTLIYTLSISPILSAPTQLQAISIPVLASAPVSASSLVFNDAKLQRRQLDMVSGILGSTANNKGALNSSQHTHPESGKAGSVPTEAKNESSSSGGDLVSGLLGGILGGGEGGGGLLSGLLGGILGGGGGGGGLLGGILG